MLRCSDNRVSVGSRHHQDHFLRRFVGTSFPPFFFEFLSLLISLFFFIGGVVPQAPTSGLLLCAKTASARVTLGNMFEIKTVRKRYTALVVGRLDGEGEIKTEMDGKFAHSKYTVVAHHRSIVPGWITTVDLWPLTGRTHQLRKHMQHMGTPILGDTVYVHNQYRPYIRGAAFCLSAQRSYLHMCAHTFLLLFFPRGILLLLLLPLLLVDN